MISEINKKEHFKLKVCKNIHMNIRLVDPYKIIALGNESPMQYKRGFDERLKVHS